MATTGMQLPASNPAGNNQTSPGVGMAGAKPIAVPFSGAGAGAPVQNPYFSTPAVGATGALPAGAAPAAGTGGMFDAKQAADTTKQFEDIFGKGTGGALSSILSGMSGENSQIFQQFLASIHPAQAAAKADLNQTLGATGVSGNSSVSALANANLEAQFTAQEAGVNADLMKHGLDQSINILQGTQAPAAQEVATSGWSIFGDVMQNVTSDIGNLIPGAHPAAPPNLAASTGAVAAAQGAGYKPGAGVDTINTPSGGLPGSGGDYFGVSDYTSMWA